MAQKKVLSPAQIEKFKKALGADEVIPLKSQSVDGQIAEALAIHRKRQRKIREQSKK